MQNGKSTISKSSVVAFGKNNSQTTEPEFELRHGGVVERLFSVQLSSALSSVTGALFLLVFVEAGEG
jgi:hypothetical protein